MSSGDGTNGSSSNEPGVPDGATAPIDDEAAVAAPGEVADPSTGSADTGSGETGPEETGPEETGPEDTGSAVVGEADPAAQRDEYLEALQRVKAEFANYRKRVDKERAQVSDRAAGRLAEQLLPVLDACDSGVAHGDAGAEAIRSQLVDVLGRSGLEIVDAIGKPFDPQVHEAVLREEGPGGAETVVEIMRAGYTWQGRVLRPAMVKVGS